MSTPDAVQATALPAVQLSVTVAAPSDVDPPPLTVSGVVSSHSFVLAGVATYDKNGDVTESVPTVSIVMSPAALVMVSEMAVDAAALADVPLMTGVTWLTPLNDMAPMTTSWFAV